MPGTRQGDSRRGRLWWRAYRRVGRLPRPVPALGRAVALGVMRPDDLHAFNVRWYAAQPARYGRPDYVESGFFDWEVAAVDGWFPASGRVLVAAAGAGREMLALHRRGYAVHGFDPSAELRACAAAPFAAAGLAATVDPAEHDRVPPLDGPYVAAVLGWSAYGFIATAERRVAFLAELSAALAPGAPVLLSMWGRRPPSRRYDAVLRVANLIRRARHAPPASPGDDLEPYFVHRFTAAEVRSELAAAGFEPLAVDLGRGFAVARRS
jgi:SAM-dependent methyltransferase